MPLNGVLLLAVTLLMFPQVAQGIFSPALADIEQVMRVSAESVAQLLSLYFLAFALGVVAWGRICDRIGRRPSLLAGLALYSLATGLSLLSPTFQLLLATQALAAFAASACSVVTQTLLRDRFQGAALAQVFSLVGMALAASPALGLFTGAQLVSAFGYKAVLYCLLVLAMLLFLICARILPETRPCSPHTPRLLETLAILLRDAAIWRAGLWVAAFNIALFSYYSLGPFLFQKLGLDGQWFGYSGMILALGAGLGAGLNRRLLQRGWNHERLLRLASWLLLGSALAVLALQRSGLFCLPMLGVALAFGLAIPNVLGAALAAYGDRLGTAGALFGLIYYLLIGSGLMLVAWSQNLGGSLLVCGVMALVLSYLRLRA